MSEHIARCRVQNPSGQAKKELFRPAEAEAEPLSEKKEDQDAADLTDENDEELKLNEQQA